jgi:3-hexulose-6-phosphate synthase
VLLQLAIDDPASMGVIPEVLEFVDILEVGTPLLKRFGLAAISTVVEAADGKPVLVDTKTADAGAREAQMVFGQGAALMTVLSAATAATFDAVNAAARAHGGHVILDTVTGALPTRSHAYPERFSHIGLHAPTDRRLAGFGNQAAIDSITSMHDLGYLVSIAGGIDAETIDAVVEKEPEIVVVGSAICLAHEPRRVARWLSSRLVNRGRGWPPSRRSPR